MQLKAGHQDKQQAVKAIHATLQTFFGAPFQRRNGAAGSPVTQGTAAMFEGAGGSRQNTFKEFMQRGGRREGTDRRQAEQHARAVIEVLCRVSATVKWGMSFTESGLECFRADRFSSPSYACNGYSVKPFEQSRKNSRIK